MRIGVPRERKDGELRVGMLPDGVRQLFASGNDIVVEAGAGKGVGCSDADYAAAGARIVADSAEVFGCSLIVKVKELQATELPLVQASSTIFGFAQLSGDRSLLDAVLSTRAHVIAYETVTDVTGELPLLAPMSRIAGRLAPLIAARLLLTDHGGSGILMMGADDAPPAQMTIVGAGMVGAEAAATAVNMGAAVMVLARTDRRLAALRACFGAALSTRVCEPDALAAALAASDIVIGAVLQRGKVSPTLVTRPMLRAMREGSVLVDVGIDHGGIAETSRSTTLSAPTYVDEGVTHYCVPNMPALAPRTATHALTRATLPYVLRIAELGVVGALAHDAGLRAGLQVYDGGVVHAGLADDAGVSLTHPVI